MTNMGILQIASNYKQLPSSKIQVLLVGMNFSQMFCQGAMSEDLGDLLVEDGEEMFEALSQMPVISISNLILD